MIYNKLYDFLNDNLLLSDNSGLEKDTELACISLSEHLLRQMDAEEIPLTIFLDFSKAFDTKFRSRYIIMQP